MKTRPLLNREDRDRALRLHRERPGVYRVGASPLTIRRYRGGRRPKWDIYGDTLEGLARIPGRWSFDSLSDARRRAFEFASERGWA